MKWYVNQTKAGESDPSVLGPFDLEADADAQKTALDADFPADAISDPFEEADGYLDTLPVVTMIVSTGEGDAEVYSDGTQKLLE